MDDQQQFLQKLNRRTRFTQFLVWIALFFTAAGIAAGYKNWLRIHDKAKAGLAGIAEIREEIPSFAKKEQVLPLQATVNKLLKNNSAHIDKALLELKEIQLSTKYLATTVYDQVEQITRQHNAFANIQKPTVIQDWSISEVRFLLQTAIQVLHLKQDKKAAMTAFSMADKLLLERSSTEFLPLRKQISQDIALLSQYAFPDTALLSEKISLLQHRLESEKSMGKNNKVTTPNTIDQSIDTSLDTPKKERINEKADKNSIINRVKQTIKEAVVVRRFDQSLHAEMDEETQDNLFQLLSLKLETLRIMLLQRQNKNYHQQIKRIKVLLKKYYPESKLIRYKSILEDLDSVNLMPEIPDISASLKLLDSISALAKPTSKLRNE